MEINNGHASTWTDSERLFQQKYVSVGIQGPVSILGKARLGIQGSVGFYPREGKARCMVEDVVINCQQDNEGNISCTSSGGDCVGLFPLPPGEQPFDKWVADELVASRNLSQAQLRLVDPNGSIFCTRKPCAEFVFIKSRRHDEDAGMPTVYLRQVAIQKDLIHKHVVRLLDILCAPDRLLRVFEFLEVDLREYMKKRDDRCLSQDTIKHFVTHLMSGMDFLHTRRIMHRDLKPRNLFIDDQEVLKIGGLELSRKLTVPVCAYTHNVVSVWYRPPEILLGCKIYSLPIDMWSCGCCLGEMASGYPLFPGDSEIDTIFHIFKKMGTPTEQQWNGLNELPDFKHTFPKWTRKSWSEIRNLSTQLGQDGLELLDGLLQYDPANRLSARAALKSQYLAD